MQASIEKLDGLERKITITVPNDEIKKLYDQKLSELTKTAKVDGFRPGKVPPEVIEKRYKSGLQHEVMGQVIESTFPKAVEENKVRVAGLPKVEPGEFSKSSDFQYTATFEVYPDVEIKDLSSQKVEKISASVDDGDIDEMISRIQRQFADWEDVEREAERGDHVVIDFTGYLNDEPFEGGQAEKYELELGSGAMIPGFEDQLIGIKVGEERDINVTFPEQYPSEELKGQPARFAIKVHNVKQPKLPEIDDNLADKVGVKGGLIGLRDNVRDEMERELKNVLVNKNKMAVLDKLIELNPVDLPNSLIDQEIKHLQSMTLQQMAASQGKDELPEIDLPREPYLEQAEKRVTLGLLIAEVIKAFDVQLDDVKVKKKVKELAKSFQKPDEVEAWYFQNKDVLAEVEASVLEEEAVAKLLESAEVTEKAVSYKEALGQTESK